MRLFVRNSFGPGLRCHILVNDVEALLSVFTNNIKILERLEALNE